MNFIRNLFSLKYYTLVLQNKEIFHPFLITFILVLLFSIKPSFLIYKDFYPAVRDLESKVTTFINDVYPKELEIKIKNGTVFTNVTEPYYLVIKKETLDNMFSLKKTDSETNSKIRILAIDTKGKAENFEQYQSASLLTKNSLIYYKDGKINITPLREIKDLTINKEVIINKVKEINKKYSVFNLINIGVLASPLFIISSLFVSQLFAFLFLSIASYLMVRINQVQTNFRNTFRYTVAVSIIPLLIWNLLLLVSPLTSNLKSVESLLNIIILGFAYTGIRKIKTL